MTEYRVAVVGAGGVGKSALTVRFVRGVFVKTYDPTIEDSYRKQIEVDKKARMLDIMDTAGQEEYSALRDQFLQASEGFVLVYSIAKRSSFEAVAKLRQQILRIKEEAGEVPIMLVGNKVDLENEREVSTENGFKTAEKWNAGFIEVSAKTNKNINELFVELIQLIDKYREKHPDKAPKGASKKKGEKGGKCFIL